MKGVLLQGGRHVDISLGTLNGIQAALYFRAQMLAIAPLRPLALVIKALLKVGSTPEHWTQAWASITQGCSWAARWDA